MGRPSSGVIGRHRGRSSATAPGSRGHPPWCAPSADWGRRHSGTRPAGRPHLGVCIHPGGSTTHRGIDLTQRSGPATGGAVVHNDMPHATPVRPRLAGLTSQPRSNHATCGRAVLMEAPRHECDVSGSPQPMRSALLKGCPVATRTCEKRPSRRRHSREEPSPVSCREHSAAAWSRWSGRWSAVLDMPSHRPQPPRGRQSCGARPRRARDSAPPGTPGRCTDVWSVRLRDGRGIAGRSPCGPADTGHSLGSAPCHPPHLILSRAAAARATAGRRPSPSCPGRAAANLRRRSRTRRASPRRGSPAGRARRTTGGGRRSGGTSGRS
jgi:hypothetical protein